MYELEQWADISHQGQKIELRNIILEKMILWEAVRLVSSCRLYRCIQTILVFSTVGCDVSVAVSATGPKPHHTILLNTRHDPHQRWQAECQSCPLISQECPTPAPGPHNTMPWHNITQHTIQYHTTTDSTTPHLYCRDVGWPAT